MEQPTRRAFVAALSTLAVGAHLRGAEAQRMRFGLVTYMWGADWDLPTLIANCEAAGALGVELRTTHKHGVEPTLSPGERREVRKRFADSQVTLLGPGSNENFDSPDADKLAASIEATKKFIVLSHDVGGTGVKVKPDNFHEKEGVPREKTIEQIGRALNALGPFATDHGQEIRLEVHGQCAELPTIRAILDIADHPSIAICWNCNPQDLLGGGLEHNFNLVKHRFGRTVHIHPHDHPTHRYPYADFVSLLKGESYDGWLLLEAAFPIPEQRVKALVAEREAFERMIAG